MCWWSVYPNGKSNSLPQQFPHPVPWRPINVKKATLLLTLLLITCACAVGPKYKRPNVDVPGTYRGAFAQGDGSETQQSPGQQASPTAQQTPQTSEQSVGDQKWSEV